MIESRIGELNAKENLTPEEEADLYWLKLLGDADPEDIRKAAFVLLHQEMTRPRTGTEAAAKPGTEAGTQTAAETGSAATQTENTNEWQAFDVLGRDADQEEALKNQPDTDKYEYKIELNPEATAEDELPYVIYRRAKQGATQTAAETGSAATAAPAEIGTIQASEAAEDGELEASARAERELKLRRELPHNPADTQAEIEKWKKLFPGINIETVTEWTPEQIRVLRRRGVLAPEKAQGMFDIKTNTVILNVSNLRPSEVGFKILHEVGLHLGIRQAFGDEAANTLFLAVFDAMQDSPFMQRIIDTYKLRTPMLDENGEAIYNPDGTPLFDDMTDAQKAEAAEEFLAFAAETYGVPIDEIYADNRAEIDKWGREHGRDTHDWNEKRRMTREWMAETGFKPERPGWWKQLISQIRVWLAQHGFGHLREADIETIIQDSFKAAYRTNRTNRTNGESRFSIEDVWTGSAADYEKPDMNYVGTGEGAQEYGYGLYGSSSRGVGEGYAEADVERKNAEAYSLSNSLTIKGKRLRDDQTLRDFVSSVYPEDKLKQCVAITISSSMRDASSFEDLVEIAKENGGYYMKSNGYSKEEWDAACEEVGEDIELTERKRNLYRQTFWPDKKENLLDWDEDLPDEQRDKIFAELEKDSPYKYIGEDQQYGKVFEHKLTKKHLLG